MPDGVSAVLQRLIDRRNRLAACKLAGVEPRFEQLNGRNPIAYIINANTVHTHRILYRSDEFESQYDGCKLPIHAVFTGKPVTSLPTAAVLPPVRKRGFVAHR